MTPSMTSPHASAKPSPTPLVEQVFGETRFHTEGDIAALAFASDGTVYSMDEAGVLMHWSADGTLLKRTFLSDLETVWVFDPSTRYLVSGNDDLLFWDVAEGHLIKRLSQPAWVTSIALRPDGQLIASGHDNGTVRFWDTATQQFMGEIQAHPESSVSAIAFSPKGDYLVSAGEDRLVRLWDATTHKCVGEFRSHTDRIPALAWSPDGKYFVSAGWDTSARVWQPTHADPMILLNSHADQVVMLAFSPRSQVLATADSDNDIHLWTDPLSGKQGLVLKAHTDEIRCLAFNADGTRLASAGADRIVHIWDTTTGQLVAGPNPTGQQSLAVLTLPDQRQLLASAGGPKFRLWDLATGQEVNLPGMTSAYSVTVSPDNRWLAVGGTDHFTRLYDAHKLDQPPRLLEATKPPIGAVSMSSDGKLLAHTSPADGLVWLWETDKVTSDAKLILIEAADGCTLEDVVIHPDGQHVLVGGIDYLSTGERSGAVCLWDLNTNSKKLVFDVGVYALAIDTTGHFAAGAGVNDSVYLWDLKSEELVFELAGHQERIHAITFSPDGNYILSGGEDGTIRVWDVLSGRLLVIREFDSPIEDITFSRDGKTLFSGNSNTTCYQIEFQKLLES